MKKLFAIALISTISITSFAQNFNFGIQAGPNFSKVSKTFLDKNQNDIETDYLVGFHAGVYLTLGLDVFSIQPEANFSTKGFSRNDGLFDYKSRINYLDVPILFQGKVADNIYLFAGPQASFLVSQKTSGKIGDGNGNSIIIENDDRGDFNSAEGSFVFGGKVKVGNLNIGARYNFGLTDVYENDPSEEKARNNWVQVTLGFDLL